MLADGNEGGNHKPVSPELYTREYFTTDCEGYHLFLQGQGLIPKRIMEALETAGDLSEKWVLDIGCGRGELVYEAARRGAHAVGIDYSAAAIELSQELLAHSNQALRNRIELLKTDTKELPFPPGSFDVVFMVDVYEHLHPNEIMTTLTEIRRLLRPGGLLVVHTGPNTWFYKYGYPLVKAVATFMLRRELPEDLRGQYDDFMHVNEQSSLSLYRGLTAAGYRTRVIPRSFFIGINPSRWERMVMKVLFARPTGYLFCTSLMATASPREGGDETSLRVNRMLDMIRPQRGSRVLLIGEQEGLLARRLADLVDVQVTWLEPGVERASGHEATPTQPGGYARIWCDPLHLPYSDQHFDTVAAQFTLDYVESPERALSEWVRVLKEGGKLALVVKNQRFKGWEPRPGPRQLRSYSPSDLKRLAVRAGLEVKEVTTLIPDLKLPALYRGDLHFSLYLERLPFFAKKGRLLFLNSMRKERGCRAS